jgi:hypothetical protein
MPVAQAQRSRVVALPALIDQADIERVHACAATAERRLDCGDTVGKHPDIRWRTLYLHAAGLFQQQCGDLLARILRRVREAEAGEPSAAKILSGKDESSVGVRCVEYHEVQPGGSLPDKNHYDVGSLVTIDILLSHPSDFRGGVFTTLEADGTQQQHQFGGRSPSERGDGLLFVSHKYHNVSAVLSGTRRVLVIELWNGPSTCCNHRCNSPYACSLKHWAGDDFRRAIEALSDLECETGQKNLR